MEQNKVTTVVKATYEGDMRRISFDKNLTFEEFKSTLQELFSLDNSSSIHITYQDDDGDSITISSDIELEESFRLAQNLKPQILKVAIQLTGKTPPVPVVSETTCKSSPSSSPQPATQPQNPFQQLQGLNLDSLFANLQSNLGCLSGQTNLSQNLFRILLQKPELMQLLPSALQILQIQDPAQQQQQFKILLAKVLQIPGITELIPLLLPLLGNLNPEMILNQLNMFSQTSTSGSTAPQQQQQQVNVNDILNSTLASFDLGVDEDFYGAGTTTTSTETQRQEPVVMETENKPQEEEETQAKQPELSEYENQIHMLASMGFENREQSLALLRQFGGDLQATVTALLF